MKGFLQKYIKPKKGKIIFEDKEVGAHDGIFYYTIGQRHGLGLSSGPYFIIDKDIKENILYVSKDSAGIELKSKNAEIIDVSWVNEKPEKSFNAGVKIRYRDKTFKAKIIPGKKTKIEFIEPVKALTSGQAAVIYKGETVLGGGIIV